MNYLFICSQNKLRSPTAEQIFSEIEGFDVRSAGIDRDAVYSISSEDIEWADKIFVMERHHRNKLLKKFKNVLKDQRLIILNIPDDYEYMDKELKRKMKIHFH